MPQGDDGRSNAVISGYVDKRTCPARKCKLLVTLGGPSAGSLLL